MADVLIIDDDEIMRGLLLEMMAMEGVDSLSAEDGTNVIDTSKNENVRLVITDLIMPGKEGLETITTLKRELPHIKIIAISGGGRICPDSYLGIAQDLGAHFTFSKPFRTDQFLAAVRECLQS